MTNLDLLTKTFAGVVLSSEFTAKDGTRIGYINPNDPVVCGAITAKKVAAGKQRCDGNISFVYPDGKTKYAEGNAENLHPNDCVVFRIRIDAKGMPQAYDVRLGGGEEDIFTLTEKNMIKPKSVSPTQPTPAVEPDLAPAVSAGLAEMDEDEEDGIELDESLIDFEDEEDEYYDPDRIWGSSKRFKKPKQKNKKKERYDD